MPLTWTDPSTPDFNYSDTGAATVHITCSRTSAEGTRVGANVDVTLNAVDDGLPMPTDADFEGWLGPIIDGLVADGWTNVYVKQSVSVSRHAV